MRPLIIVSVGGIDEGGALLIVELALCPCRTTNVKLKINSSSVFNRSMNEGDEDDWPGSGSCRSQIYQHQAAETHLVIAYLHVFHNSVIADVSLGSNFCRRESVGYDIQQDFPP